MAGGGLTATVSAEGQVIPPKAIRDQMQWGVGTQLAVEQTADGVLLRPVCAVFPATRPEDVFGCLGPAREAKSVEEMEAGIMAEVRRRHARGRY